MKESLGRKEKTLTKNYFEAFSSQKKLNQKFYQMNHLDLNEIPKMLVLVLKFESEIVFELNSKRKEVLIQRITVKNFVVK